MKNKKLQLNKLISLLVVFSFMFSFSVNAQTFSNKKESLPLDMKQELTKKTRVADNAKSAEPFFSETFDTEIPATWTLSTVGAGWVYGGALDGMVWHYDDKGTQNDWLISPAIDVPRGGLYLDYWEYVNYASYAGSHNVVVATEADMSDGVIINDVVSAGGWNNVNLYLDEWDNKTIYIGFQYVGDYSSWWGIDDFTLLATTNILTFEAVDQALPTEIDFENSTITTYMPYGYDLSAVTVNFTTTSGATSAPETGSVIDLTNGAVPITVTSPNGAGIEVWYVEVVVSNPPIVSFDFEADANAAIEADVIGVVDVDGQEVAAVVPYATDVTELIPAIVYGPGVMVTPTTFFDAAMDFTNPVDFELDGTESVEWTATVTEVAPAISEFKFVDVEDTYGALSTVNGIIETDTIWVTVPYNADVTELVPVIAANPGATISPAGAQDFSVVVEYTVSGGQTDKTYKVVVDFVDPIVETELISISIENMAIDNDGETLEIYRDNYAQEIEMQVLTDSALTALHPVFEVSEYATISYGAKAAFEAGDAVDFTNPVVFTITSQDGENTSEWLITVTNQDSLTGNDILDASVKVDDANVLMAGGDSIQIDADAKRVVAYVVDGTVLADIDVTFEISPFAKIVLPETPDYTATVNADVVSQSNDTSAWTVQVLVEDLTIPVATASDVTITNWGDSVFVYTNETPGYVGILLDGESTDLFFTDEDDLNDGDKYKFVSVEVAAGDTGAFIFPNGVEAGNYAAYACDSSGNISVAAVDAVIEIDTAIVEIASIREFRDGYPTVIYDIAAEAVITHHINYKNKKWLTDGTAGIMVYDPDAVIIDTLVGGEAVYNTGDAFMNLQGMQDSYKGLLEFIPYVAPDSAWSTGNEVTPIVITLDQLAAEGGLDEFEGQLVTVENVSFPIADGDTVFKGGKNLTIENYTTATFRTDIYEANYIDSVIPEGAINLTAVVGSYNGTPQLIARTWDDFVAVEVPVLYTEVEEVDFESVLVGEDGDITFKVGNIGANGLEISKIYLEGHNDFVLGEAFVDVTLANNEFVDVNIWFVPVSYGEKEATLFIEYGEEVLEIPVIGEGAADLLVDAPYENDFEEQVDGWNQIVIAGDKFVWGEHAEAGNLGWMHLGYSSGSSEAVSEAYLVSPRIDLTTVVNPALTFVSSSVNGWAGTTKVMVSTDKVNWTELMEVEEENFEIFTYSCSLEDYADQVVYIGFYVQEIDWGYGQPINWWEILDFKVAAAPVNPIFAVDQDIVDFGPIELADTAAIELTVFNNGVSYFNIDTVYVVTNDTSFLFTNEIVYPFTTRDGDAKVEVKFAPDTSGIHEAKVVIEWTDPILGDSIVEVPVTGLGYEVACEQAMEAVEGENAAAFQPAWYEYTASQDGIVHITSCYGDQKIDTDLKVYANCGDEDVIAENDDIDSPAYDGSNLCENGYNYASDVKVPVAEGDNLKIYWYDHYNADAFVFVIDIYDLPEAPALVAATADEVFPTIIVQWEGIPVSISQPDALYNLYRDGMMIAENMTSTMFIDQGLDFNTEYCYKVEQVLPDGSISPFSNNICTKTAMTGIDGDICETAIVVDLPVVNDTASTEEFGNDYADPGVCNDYYLSGNDVVYEFTLEKSGYLTGSIEGKWAAMHIVDGCPSASGIADDFVNDINCVAIAYNNDTIPTNFANRAVDAGTYYVIVSSWAPPAGIDYIWNLSFTERVFEVSISDIQGETEVSPYAGEYVVTTGIVTATYANGYYLQDGEGEWTGIQVYDPERNAVLGDEVTIAGTCLEYFGVTNIEDVTDYTVVSSDNDLPEAQVVLASEIGEAYEGVLIKVEEVLVFAKDLDHGDFAAIQNNTELLVNDVLYAYDPIIGDEYNFKGVLTYSWDEYKIRPRSEDDIDHLVGINNNVIDNAFAVYPNPNNGIFTVVVNDSKANDLTVELVNVQGEVIYSQRADNVTTFSNEIDVTEFAKGVYYLRVFNGEEVKVEKVIVK